MKRCAIAKRVNKREPAVVLTLHQLKGAFYVLVFGCGLSFVSFVFENLRRLVSSKVNRKRVMTIRTAMREPSLKATESSKEPTLIVTPEKVALDDPDLETAMKIDVNCVIASC